MASTSETKIQSNEAARQLLHALYAIYTANDEDLDWMVAPGDKQLAGTGLSVQQQKRGMRRLQSKGLVSALTTEHYGLLPNGIEAAENPAILDVHFPLPGHADPRMERSMSADPKKVFVVYGRNQAARKATFDFLRTLGLSPMEWNEVIDHSGKGAPHVSEAIDASFKVAKAVVVVLTGDDEARLRRQFCDEGEEEKEKTLSNQARPNVIFEAGLAFGRHPENTIILQIGSMRPISDIAGLHFLRYTGKQEGEIEFRNALATRLERAGCDVSKKGTDWLTAGDFKAAFDTHNRKDQYT